MSSLYDFMMEKACNTKCNTQETIELGSDSIKLNNVCVANNEIVGIDGLVEIAAYNGNSIPSSGDVNDPDMTVNMHVVIYMQLMSIDMMLTKKDGSIIGKKSVVIGNTADDSNKQPMVDFVHGVCEMLHWETDEKSIKMMAKNVVERGIKEMMRKAIISSRK